jgi:hypothetical protein
MTSVLPTFQCLPAKNSGWRTLRGADTRLRSIELNLVPLGHDIHHDGTVVAQTIAV